MSSDKWHPRTAISERREANKVIVHLDTWSLQGGGTQTEPSGIPELRTQV